MGERPSSGALTILRTSIVEAFMRVNSAERAVRRLRECVAVTPYQANPTELTYLRDTVRQLRAVADDVETLIEVVGAHEIAEVGT
jgi:hypothetical protein